jgi:glycosyltransferase WbpL
MSRSNELCNRFCATFNVRGLRVPGDWVTASVALCVLLLSVSLTWAVRRYALRTNLIDEPNARSSHTRATPRGGGLGIVVASMIGTFALWRFDLVEFRLFAAFVLGGALVATIGFLDDRKGVAAIVRLGVHVAAACIGVSLIGGVSHIELGSVRFDLGLSGFVLAVVCLVWTINLFNFMDGIDGIAGSEAVFVTFASAAMMILLNGVSGSASICVVVGAASLGFLVWNWPPARIFMGDVGSGYLGYCIGLTALAAAKENVLQVIPFLLLGGVFFVDATLTVVRRLARGERVHQAHRTHAYQWLAAHWASHLRVTLLVLSVNLLWLLPFAAWAALCKEYALWALLALVPIALGCFFIGSGAAESRFRKARVQQRAQ